MHPSKLMSLATVLCLTLSGCGGSRQEYKYRIAVVPKGLTHEFWQSIHRGAERAALDLQQKGLNVQVIWSGPKKESDSAEQISIVDLQVGKQVNGIVLAPQLYYDRSQARHERRHRRDCRLRTRPQT